MSFVDPYGLVKWYGEGKCGGLSEFVGASSCNYRFISDCVNGKQAIVEVVIVGPFVGFSIAPVGTSGGTLNVRDRNSEINPMNLQGSAVIPVVSVMVGTGFSITDPKIGNTYGPRGENAGIGGWGFDVSIGILAGSSTITDIRWIECSNKDECGE